MNEEEFSNEFIAAYEAGKTMVREDIADILADFPEYRRYEPLKQIAELVGFEWEQSNGNMVKR